MKTDAEIDALLAACGERLNPATFVGMAWGEGFRHGYRACEAIKSGGEQDAPDKPPHKPWPTCGKCLNVMDGVTTLCPDGTPHLAKPHSSEECSK